MTSKKANVEKRKKGKDKAKESFKRNGKFSSKHLRIQEQMILSKNKKNTSNTNTNTKKNTT